MDEHKGLLNLISGFDSQQTRHKNTCPFCGKEFLSKKGWTYRNHVYWCKNNPRHDEIREHNKEYLKTARQNIKSRRNGYSPGAKLYQKGCPEETRQKIREKSSLFRHTEETKQKIREKALKSKHRRLRRKIIEYNGVQLDSTWELELAKRLDSLGIEWVRPGPLEWVDSNGISHNYFPDFYLPEHNIYLDPKNPYAIISQKNKLDVIIKKYNVILLETLLECKNFNLERIMRC